jgi:hypothetical protein
MRTLPTKAVLFALSPASRVVLRTAIPDNFQCYWYTSLAQIQQTMHKRLELIVCCTLFDSSQMFDLIRYCKASPALHDTPILCVRAIGGAFDDAAFHGVAIACKTLGASYFLDINRMIAGLGHEQALKAANKILTNLCEKKLGSHFYLHSDSNH